jgi:hypothetical protein
MVQTQNGKKIALAALKERRLTKPAPINNARLPAGSAMYFYCISCGHESDVLPEGFINPPKKFCKECQALKDIGWLE